MHYYLIPLALVVILLSAPVLVNADEEFCICSDSNNVIVEEPPFAAQFDSNRNNVIDRDEAIDAVIRYFIGDITKEQAIDIIILYFSGTPIIEEPITTPELTPTPAPEPEPRRRGGGGGGGGVVVLVTVLEVGQSAQVTDRSAE